MARKKTPPPPPVEALEVPSWTGRRWFMFGADAWMIGAELAAAVAELKARGGGRVHVISDPPYGESTHNGVVRGAGAGVVTALSFAPIQPGELVPKLLSLPGLDGWIVAFCELEALGEYKAAANAGKANRWRRAAIAPRTHPQPQMSGDRPAVAADGIAVIWGGIKGRSKWNRGGHAGTWDLPTCRDADRFHETQKPASTMRELILAFTAPRDIVIDPFAGSATTGAAALGAGRYFIGVEIQPHYAERAAARLEAAESTIQDNDAPPDAARHAVQLPVF